MTTQTLLLPNTDKVPTPRTRTTLRDQPDWIKAGIFFGNTFHYRKKNPWIHNSINLSIFGLILMGVAGLVFLSTTLPLVIYLPFAIFSFGLCHFIMLILVVHEASHNMFIVSKNVKRSLFWNRLFGWTVATFYGVEYGKHWEVGHQIHHYEPIEDHDPQNCPNTIYSGSDLFKYTIAVLFLPGYYQFFQRKYDQCEAAKHYGVNPKLLAGQIVLWVLLIAASMIYFNGSVPIAIFLGTQVVAVLNQFKIVMEHGGEIGRRENAFLRSCSSFFPFRWLLMPLNISLHFEHHLNYCVPWYDLMRYHRGLEKMVPPEIRLQIFHYNTEVWRQIKNDIRTDP